ncbi:MAG TPA: hypothetical protein VMN60_12675 [Longimicrobiales bacterium]|nr:hypothetical protein [Longimicrobiales bacterium]
MLALALTGAAAWSGCGRSPHAELAPDVQRELVAGRAALATWAEQQRAGVPADEVVIALGYAERLRLGLGSPFRLVAAALQDPRLSEDMQRRLSWALLARTLDGAAYEIDAVALDRAGMTGVASWPGLGRHHLKLIESAIVESSDPRGGEMAVRLAYRLAANEGSVPAGSPSFATRAAALIRDRELARSDAWRLLRSAEVVAGDPLNAIGSWRSEQWLRVEAPPMAVLPESVEREALELAPRLAQSLRALAPRLGDITQQRPNSPDVNASLLLPRTARRLTEIADSFNMPPQAPVVIAARTYRMELMQQPWLTEGERERRDWFTTLSNEERFVAGYALLARSSPYDAAPSLSVLWAAVALRTYAQEPVWFPGFGGPGVRELEERFGLASVKFSEQVPAAWRPFYRTVLATALHDMQRVLPALDVRGLSVRFGPAPRGAATLAMHDPRARRLVLPPGSSAGTIAHEIAHDLDWQVALRRYRVRGDYGTDRAERLGQHDRLAVQVRTLVEAAALDDATADAHTRRPAENFARAVDWFVAASLAAQGRTNGYLTSIQDEVLTGYGTVRSPDITGRAGNAIVDILDEVAPLHPETRTWFLAHYGTARAHGEFDLVRMLRLVELPRPIGTYAPYAAARNDAVAAAFDSIGAVRQRGMRAVDAWLCRAPAGAHDTQLEQARRRFVVEAAASRARGIALQHARRIGGETGVRWVTRQLYGGAWPLQEVEPGLAAMLGELVDAARGIATADAPRQTRGFELMWRPEGCANAGGWELGIGRAAH